MTVLLQERETGPQPWAIPSKGSSLTQDLALRQSGRLPTYSQSQWQRFKTLRHWLDRELADISKFHCAAGGEDVPCGQYDELSLAAPVSACRRRQCRGVEETTDAPGVIAWFVRRITLRPNNVRTLDIAPLQHDSWAMIERVFIAWRIVPKWG